MTKIFDKETKVFLSALSVVGLTVFLFGNHTSREFIRRNIDNLINAGKYSGIERPIQIPDYLESVYLNEEQGRAVGVVQNLYEQIQLYKKTNGRIPSLGEGKIMFEKALNRVEKPYSADYVARHCPNKVPNVTKTDEETSELRTFICDYIADLEKP